MKLLHAFPLAAFGLVLLSIVSFCAAGEQIELLLIAGALAAMSWYVTEGPRGFALPRWLSSILIMAASIAVVPDIMSNRHDVMGVLGRFAVWLSVIKLYERKSHRDYAQLLWLSLVLMIAGVLSSRQLFFGLALLLYAAGGLYVLLLYQLHARHEEAVRERAGHAPQGHRLVPPVRPVLGRTVKGQFQVLTAALGMLGLVLSAVIFILVPRGVGAGAIQRLSADATTPRTGFAGRVDLHSSIGSRITDSKTPVFELAVTEADGKPVALSGPFYLRGATLDEYDPTSFTWVASRPLGSQRRELDVSDVGFTPLGEFVPRHGTAFPHERAVEFAFTPLMPIDTTLFTPMAPLALSMDEAMTVRFDERTHMLRLPEGVRLVPYRLKVDLSPDDSTWRAISTAARGPGSRGRLYDNLRVKAEAERIAVNAGLPPQPPADESAHAMYAHRFAEALVAHFERGFTYTTDLGDVTIPTGNDPIEAFLFDFRRGHCEYYASAMTALCQSIGLEARLVTGYLAAEGTGEGRFIVRESNAHAWVEVRIGRWAWETFDPTPMAVRREIAAPSPTLASRVRAIYEYFELGWIRNIVDFDRSSQSRVRQNLSLVSLEWLDRAVSAGGEWLTRFVRRFGALGTVWIVVVASAGVVAVLIVAKLVRRARRIRRTLHLEHVERMEYRRLLRQLGFYLDMLDILNRGGFEKPRWLPPRAFADRIRPKRPEIADDVRDLTDLFYAARYGGAILTSRQAGDARQMLQRLAIGLAVRR